MNFINTLRLPPAPTSYTICFAGSGGKTTALFQLAQELIHSKHKAVILTATSHLGTWQTHQAQHHILTTEEVPKKLPAHGITLITGPIEDARTKPITPKTLYWLREHSRIHNIPLLIEADGSRQKPLKAPADHEPPIPEFADIVVYMVGLSGLNKPLTENHVHRAHLFEKIANLTAEQWITPTALTHVLTHLQGGLKNIPSNAKRVAVLNQAETAELLSIAGSIALKIMPAFQSVVISSFQQQIFQVIEPTAGIVLAAGTSSRYGSPKQLLKWNNQSLVRHIAQTALQARLWPVVVVTGAHAAEIESQLKDLPVNIVYNQQFKEGQSTSIKTGVLALPAETGAAVFLLADQPQISASVITALVDSHSQKLQAILAPLVLENHRGNPVLFDRRTFSDLLTLQGDVGGRGIFDRHKVEYLPWHDEKLLYDIDSPEDYQRLLQTKDNQ